MTNKEKQVEKKAISFLSTVLILKCQIMHYDLARTIIIAGPMEYTRPLLARSSRLRVRCLLRSTNGSSGVYRFAHFSFLLVYATI